jgi:APA family basic amino acid/polyamine antiporter
MAASGDALPAGKIALRRDVTVWGSYTWGYADVGADIYAALGLVIAASQGLAPAAFALAGLIYIMIGFGYTELASTYPVASMKLKLAKALRSGPIYIRGYPGR